MKRAYTKPAMRVGEIQQQRIICTSDTSSTTASPTSPPVPAAITAPTGTNGTTNRKMIKGLP